MIPIPNGTLVELEQKHILTPGGCNLGRVTQYDKSTGIYYLKMLDDEEYIAIATQLRPKVEAGPGLE